MTDSTSDISLERWIGRREALGAVAGRCSAADAACLRRIRESKSYKRHASDWGKFCSIFLHISKTQANLAIQLLDDLGAGYFVLAQLIRISPETYRAVAPAIRDGHLHHEGDPIALVPENTGKIAAVVKNLRPKLAPSQPDPFTSLQQLSDRIVKAFSQLAASGRNPHRVAELLTMLLTRLERIGRDL